MTESSRYVQKWLIWIREDQKIKDPTDPDPLHYSSKKTGHYEVTTILKSSSFVFWRKDPYPNKYLRIGIQEAQKITASTIPDSKHWKEKQLIYHQCTHRKNLCNRHSKQYPATEGTQSREFMRINHKNLSSPPYRPEFNSNLN